MTNVDLQKYKDLGWEFKNDSWTSPHNGDIDDEICAKSPRLKDFFIVKSSRHLPPSWESVSEEYLLKREALEFGEQEANDKRSLIQWQIEMGVARGERKILVDLDANYSEVFKKRHDH